MVSAFVRLMEQFVGLPSSRDPRLKTAVIEFRETDRPGRGVLYSDSSASWLAAELRAQADRLDAGTRRMPVTGGLRFVDVWEEGP
jgi:hypothetical protein